MKNAVLFFLVSTLFVSLNAFGQFGEAQLFETSQRIYSMTHIDFDGDGKEDVVGVWYSENEPTENAVVLFKNKGGVFEEEVLFLVPIGFEANFPHVFDSNGDGDLDIVLFISDEIEEDTRISFYENVGDNSYVEKQFFDIPERVIPARQIADMDNDGDKDLVYTFSSNKSIELLVNDGMGNFSNQSIISDLENFPHRINVLYANQDEFPDLVVNYKNATPLDTYLNDNLQFSMGESIIPQDFHNPGLLQSDLDGDLDLDLVIVENHTYHIYDKRPDETYLKTQTVSIENMNDILSGLTIMDVNADGLADLVTHKSSLIPSESYTYVHLQLQDKYFGEEVLVGSSYLSLGFFNFDIDCDGDNDLLNFGSRWGDSYWYPNEEFGSQLFTGNAFIDVNNNNQQDEGEPNLLMQPFHVEPIDAQFYSNEQGRFHFFVSEGEYIITSNQNALWETESQTAVIGSEDSMTELFFGFHPTRILPRVEPQLSSSATRCNGPASFWLNYSNTGTTIANGTVTLETDELIDFNFAIPEPDLVEEGRLTWNFSDLPPTHQNKIQLQFQMPNEEFIGEILENQATIQLFDENEEPIYSKSVQYDSEIRCSYDPNDKLVRSNLLGQSEFAYIGDTVLYTVRFQNTGNDTAFNIRIEDVLDKKLDWTTFHPITASHDYQTTFNRNTGLVTFHFNDILLPDSTTNEEGSHGFVMFGIASKSEIGDKTDVENTASIFFDFNPPIITNTAVLTLIEGVETDIEGTLVANEREYSILVRPNPFSDYTTIEVDGLSQNGNYRLELMDILGRKVRTLRLEGRKARLERENLEGGLYLIQVLEQNGKILGSGKVLVE